MKHGKRSQSSRRFNLLPDLNPFAACGGAWRQADGEPGLREASRRRIARERGNKCHGTVRFSRRRRRGESRRESKA